MTTFVQQRMPADCAVACLAMFLDRSYEDIAKHCSGAELVSFGVGIHRDRQICSYFRADIEFLDPSLLDWSRPAILTVPSLNDTGTHAVYWDGHRVWDPQKGRKGKASYSNQKAREFAIVGIQRASEKA